MEVKGSDPKSSSDPVNSEIYWRMKINSKAFAIPILIAIISTQYIWICDQIWESVHSSDIEFFNFVDLWNLFGTTDGCKISGIVELSFL